MTIDWIAAQIDTLVAGVDEVGRGPLAGPVVTAAVILDPKKPIEGLQDSKKLSEAKREALVPIIQQRALAYAYGRADVDEIDDINILQATMLAMQRSVENLGITPKQVRVDGNRCPQLPMPVTAIIGGDDTEPAIAAASILAKVARDQEMKAYDLRWPGYGFGQHKGYGTKKHMQALQELGATPIHRTSFAPVAKVLNQT